ncbi:hypothetical protein HGRIS_013578 [Hohenbuehelia grisea]|uniref:MYND-type domain-containing protein n=1 Tax=Hohenbuehelia grisea TaxID=104357 RepID=A0ABR3IW55_9AGAR
MNRQEEAVIAALGPDIKEAVKAAETGSLEALYVIDRFFDEETAPRLLQLLPAVYTHLSPPTISKARGLKEPDHPASESSHFNVSGGSVAALPVAIDSEEILRAMIALGCIGKLVNKTTGSTTPLTMKHVTRRILSEQDRIFHWLLIIQHLYLCDHPHDTQTLLDDVLKIVDALLQVASNALEADLSIDSAHNLKDFCIDAWYKIFRLETIPEERRDIYETVSRAMAAIWPGGSPPPLVWTVAGSKSLAADAAMGYIRLHMQARFPIRPCAEASDRFSKVSTAMEQAIGIFLDDDVATAVDPFPYVPIVMAVLRNFTARRRAIANLSTQYQCNHKPKYGEIRSNTEHCLRGLNEVRIIQRAWYLLTKFVEISSGTEVLIAAIENGLLASFMASRYDPSDYPAVLRDSDFESDTPWHIGFFTDTLPTLITFPDVLKAFGKSIQKVIFTKNTNLFPDNDECLRPAFNCFALNILMRSTKRGHLNSKVSESCGFTLQCGMQPAHGFAQRRCGGCQVVRYCSTTCQRNDWPRHREQCYLLQCSKSSSYDFGLEGLILLAAVEQEQAKSLNDKSLTPLHQAQRHSPFASNAFPVLELDLETPEASWRIRRYDEVAIHPDLQRRCWQRAASLLNANGHITLLRLRWGEISCAILSPLTSLGRLNPERWTIPPYVKVKGGNV